MFHPRSDWGALPPNAVAPITPTSGVTIHWEGTPLGVYTPEQVPGMLRSIQAFHMAPPRDWWDIAYNLVVDRFGDVWEARGLDHRSSANGTYEANRVAFAVCALLGPGDEITDGLLNGLADAVELCRSRGGAADEIDPHRHWFNTACPGDWLAGWAAQGGPRPAGTAPVPAPPTTAPPPPKPQLGEDDMPGILQHSTLGRLTVVVGDNRHAWLYTPDDVTHDVGGEWTSGLAVVENPDASIDLEGRGTDGALWAMTVQPDLSVGTVRSRGGHIFPPA